MKGSKVYESIGSCACAALKNTEHITVKCVESEVAYAKDIIDIYYEELLDAMQLAIKYKSINALEKVITRIKRVRDLPSVCEGKNHSAIYIKMFLNDETGYIKLVRAAILEESVGKILDGIIDIVRSEWKLSDAVFNFDAAIYAKLEIAK